MSGHSKWSTIKRAKGVTDAKRSQSFTKVANAIAIAARLGNSGKIEDNPRLRMIVEAARAINMPKENVQRAIDRGLGNLPGQILEEVIYEGFGPGKVAFLVETVTDNKMRTVANLRNIFERSGGALGNQGSVSYMFDKKGEIRLKTKGGNSDDEILELIDLGAEDIEDYNEDGVKKYLVYTDSTQLYNLSTKITQSGFPVESSELVFVPNTATEIKDPELAKRVLDFSEKLEDQDDIQKVHANFDIPDELV